MHQAHSEISFIKQPCYVTLKSPFGLTSFHVPWQNVIHPLLISVRTNQIAFP